MNKIATAFVKAQKEFGPALKISANPFFKSKYADLSICVAAVIDALNNNGIALIQNCHESDTGVIVETIFLHESGECISNGKLHVPSAKNDPQGYGSALTYARRYSLMAACGIAPEDDDGNAASKKPKTTHSSTDGAIESIPAERLAVLESFKSTIIDAYNAQKIKEAHDAFYLDIKDSEEQIAVWHMLKPFSALRTAIGKYHLTTKEAA